MKAKSAQKPAPMSQEAASRIQSHTAKTGDGTVPAGGFAARAQRGAELNQRSGKDSK